MSHIRSEFPSDLTDEQWKLIRIFIPPARKGGRPRTTDIRQVINAVFYLLRTGCAWRYLPKHYPPWKTVYDYFSKWEKEKIWKTIHTQLREKTRVHMNRNPEPSVLIVDSQSVKAPRGTQRGFDGYKKVIGRKRQILVDTLGLIHEIKIHSAQLQDRKESVSLLDRQKRGQIKMIYADRGYLGYFCDRAFVKLGIWPTITSLKPGGHGNEHIGSNLKPKRWIVERTFSWFNSYRRLSKDYEKNPPNSACMIYLAMTQLMLRRLCSNSTT